MSANLHVFFMYLLGEMGKYGRSKVPQKKSKSLPLLNHSLHRKLCCAATENLLDIYIRYLFFLEHSL